MKLDGYGKHAGSVIFRDRPYVVTWEARRLPTSPTPEADETEHTGATPDELTTAEGRELLSRIAQRRTAAVVLAGCGSLARPDLDTLITHAKERGLKVGLAPAPLRMLDRRRLAALVAAGLDQLLLQIDAPSAAAHDGHHKVPGSFAKTLSLVGWAHELDLAVQMETRFARWNVEHHAALAELVGELGVAVWEVLFTTPHDRPYRDHALTPRQFEEVFECLYALESRSTVWVRMREAPHFLRFALEKEGKNPYFEVEAARQNRTVAEVAGVSQAAFPACIAGDAGRATLFIDHVGDIYPSADLPIRLGNVRRDALVAVYRSSTLLQELRNPSCLKGKCGMCELRAACGGSRARAFAAAGDALGPDPACAYVPWNLRGTRRHDDGKT